MLDFHQMFLLVPVDLEYLPDLYYHFDLEYLVHLDIPLDQLLLNQSDL